MKNTCRKKGLRNCGIVAGRADASDRASDADSLALDSARCDGLPRQGGDSKQMRGGRFGTLRYRPASRFEGTIDQNPGVETQEALRNALDRAFAEVLPLTCRVRSSGSH